MKRIIIIVFVFSIAFCFAQCKKEHSRLNVILYDKSVPTIKSYIKGNWKLNYIIGGLSGNDRHDYTNSFIEFKFQTTDSILEVIEGANVIKSPITWFNWEDIFTGGKTNLLGFNYSHSIFAPHFKKYTKYIPDLT